MATLMDIPNFHDGHFDGLWIGPSKVVHLFLKTLNDKSFTLVLHGVDRLALSEIKQGNVIFDLVLRGTHELTPSDMQELYGVGIDMPQTVNVLMAKGEQELQLLELNSSYGAQGLLLFRTWEIRESTPG